MFSVCSKPTGRGAVDPNDTGLAAVFDCRVAASGDFDVKGVVRSAFTPARPREHCPRENSLREHWPGENSLREHCPANSAVANGAGAASAVAPRHRPHCTGPRSPSMLSRDNLVPGFQHPVNQTWPIPNKY